MPPIPTNIINIDADGSGIAVVEMTRAVPGPLATHVSSFANSKLPLIKPGKLTLSRRMLVFVFPSKVNCKL